MKEGLVWCVWIEEAYGYDAECGEFYAGSSQDFKYCPYCGRVIKEVLPTCNTSD